MLLDTGADISLVHGEIAKSLGIAVTRGVRTQLSGISGKAIGYVHKIDLMIAGKHVKNVPVIFSDDIAAHSFGVLGHEGIFDRIKIIIEYSKKQFEIL